MKYISASKLKQLSIEKKGNAPFSEGGYSLILVDGRWMSPKLGGWEEYTGIVENARGLKK